MAASVLSAENRLIPNRLVQAKPSRLVTFITFIDLDCIRFMVYVYGE